MTRSIINVKHTSAADLAKSLRSLAAKLDADSIVPGADLKIGNARVQVAAQQESDVRGFLRSQGIPVGTRGRISQEHQALFAAHQKAERKAAREARAARKAAQESVNA